MSYKSLTEQRAHHAEYMRRVRSKEPEKAERWRLTAAVNLLRKHGYNVNKPEALKNE